ncbi:MAG TPA: zinc-ribbon domain-containing protein, partial [Anaerolineales bacterium]|nr:zinc-ribbon domain-containing protein [Anaerolineales bacterium]
VLGAYEAPPAAPSSAGPEAESEAPFDEQPAAMSVPGATPAPIPVPTPPAAPAPKPAQASTAGSPAASPAGKMTICPRCGTQNPNLALRCSNCGAPLNVETVKPTAPAVPTARAPLPKWLIIAGALLLVATCVFIFSLIQRGQQTNEVRGVVQSVRWERIIPIEALVDVEHQAWQDEIPGGVTLGMCREQVRYESAQPEPNSEEVCGTPYTVDQGSGYAEVVQDCVYRVYDDYCSYTQPEWRVVDSVSVSGADLSPRWPQVSLAQGQRQGEQLQENYTIVFMVDGEQYSYPVSSLEAFDDFQPGSEWNLVVNGFGDLVGVER